MEAVNYLLAEKISLIEDNGYSVREKKEASRSGRSVSVSRNSYAYKEGTKYTVDEAFNAVVKELFLTINPEGSGGGAYTAGDGIDIAGSVISLGAPSTCTAGTSNNLTASSHTHEITGFDNYQSWTIEDQGVGTQDISSTGTLQIKGFDGIGVAVKTGPSLELTNTDPGSDALAAYNWDFYGHSSPLAPGDLGTAGIHEEIKDGNYLVFVEGDNVSFTWEPGSGNYKNFQIDVGSGTFGTMAYANTVDYYTSSQVDALTWDWTTDITGKPTTFAGYGISDTVSNFNIALSDGAVYTTVQIDNIMAGMPEYMGDYNASTNSPDLDSNPYGVEEGDMYCVSVAGTFFTEDLKVGDLIMAKQDNPNALGDWVRLNKNGVAWTDLIGNRSGITLTGFQDDLTYDNYVSWTISDDHSHSEAISSGDTLKVMDGTGISAIYDSTSNELTIENTSTNTWRGIDQTPVNGEMNDSISSDWAYDHTASSSAHHTKYTDGEAVSAVATADDYVKNTTDTLTGTLTVTTGIDVAGIVLEDSSHRAGLLEINREGATSWSGIQVRFSSTALWNLMADQDDFGIYDDYNSDWFLMCNENAGVELYWSGAGAGKRFETTSGGIAVTGTMSATGYNDSNWNTAYTHSQDNSQAHTDYLKNNANDSTTGVLTAEQLKADTYFWSTDAAAVFGTASSGTVYLRPVAYNSSSGQTIINSSGNMSVGGNISASGSMSATGEVTSYSSDERLKTKIRFIENPLDIIKKTEGVVYDWKDGVEDLGFTPTNQTETGYVAQALREAMEEAVAYAPFDRDVQGNSISGKDYLTTKPEKLIPVITEAIKYLDDRLKKLEQLNAN